MTRRALFGVAVVAAAQHSLDILEMQPPKSDARLSYGNDPHQFGDLRIPSGKGPHPVVVFIHGGFWKAAYSLEHAGHACAALTRAGAATWSLEYRRIGDPGGGWPGTFDDIQAGAAFVKQLANEHPLDLSRVIVAGHSAGGHLAVWLAAQKTIPLKAAIALAGVVDLRRAWELKLSSGIVEKLLGGSPQEVSARYALADPMELLPIAVPQRLIHGTADDVVPFEISQRFVKASNNAKLIPLAGTGHFELVDPRTAEWKVVEKTLLEWSS